MSILFKNQNLNKKKKKDHCKEYEYGDKAGEV